MWCSTCQQDVPAQPSPKTGRLSCPRCSGELRREANTGPGKPDTASEPVAPHSETVRFDPWEVDEQLRHLERKLRGSGGRSKAQRRREIARLDPPHRQAPSWHATPEEAKRNRRSRTAGSRSGGALAWTALALGTMVVVCGALLLVWAVVADRGELWTIGLPAAIIGQVVLLVGLVLQLDRLWRDNRTAAAKLDHVDVLLDELRTTTTLMGTGGASPGSAFYSHLAGGAGPQLLLNDLKGQLDLLALKLTQDS